MYKNILVAIDLEGGSEQVLAKAAELAGGRQHDCDDDCQCLCHQSR